MVVYWCHSIVYQSHRTSFFLHITLYWIICAIHYHINPPDHRSMHSGMVTIKKGGGARSHCPMLSSFGMCYMCTIPCIIRKRNWFNHTSIDIDLFNTQTCKTSFKDICTLIEGKPFSEMAGWSSNSHHKRCIGEEDYKLNNRSWWAKEWIIQ